MASKIKTSITDMTTGSPMKHILKFVIPLLAGMLFQQAYTTIDTIIVGKYLGMEAMGGVGATCSICFMIIGFSTGVCSGFCIPISQAFGAKDNDLLRKYVTNTVWISSLLAIIITTLSVVFCRFILHVMQTPNDIFDYSYKYLLVIFAGIPTTMMYNLVAGILRSFGDSKTPLLFLVLSTILNIVLDLLLICILPLGIIGAALATVISQGVAGICCIIYMIRRYSIIAMKKNDWKLDSRCIKVLCLNGIPMGLQFSVTAIGSVLLQVSVNELGSLAVISETTGAKINGIITCPFEALGTTMATYGGQNVGAGKYERLTQGLKAAITIAFTYAIVAFVSLYFFGDSIALLFIDSNSTAILEYVHSFLFGCSSFYMALSVLLIIRFLIQGMGYSWFSIWSGFIEMLARSLFGLLVVPAFGYIAVCYANPMAWVSADLFLIPIYIYLLKKTKKRLTV